MANIDILSMPVALSVDGTEWTPIVASGTNKRVTTQLIANLAQGFVPTTREINAGTGISGGGALSSDVTLNFAPEKLTVLTSQLTADRFVLYEPSSGQPRTVTFPNSMKAIGSMTASPAVNLTTDKLVIYHAGDGEAYSITPSQLNLPAGNVPAGGTSGQVLAKASGTDYDTAWINNAITLDALSIAANPTGGTALTTSVTLGSTLSFSGTTLRTGAGSGDVSWSANSFVTTIGANKVTDAMLRQSVGLSVVGRSASSTGNVADIAGTANQVLRVNGAGSALEFGSIDLAQSAAVGTSILPVANGGTGVASATAYALLTGGTTSTGAFQSVSGVGASGQILVSNGAAQLPSWQTSTAALGQALTKADDTNVTLTLGGAPSTALLSATSITAGWTGQLSLTRGGTNASLTASNGGMVYSSASALAVLAGTATANQIILSGSSAAPSWSTATYPATSAAGTILASATANTLAATATPTLGVAGTTLGTLALAGNTSGTVTLTPQAVAGTPTLTLPDTSGTLAASAAAPITLNSTTGQIGITSSALTKVDDTNVTLTLGGSPSSALLAATSITAGWSGQLSLSRGGTNASLTASNGGIVYSTSSALSVLSGTSTANQILMSGSSAAPSWSTATYPATTFVNQLLYSSASNVVAGLATANGGILNTGSSGVPSITATPTLGVQQTTRGSLILANTAAGAYQTTVQSSNSATAATTFTFPPDEGSNGYVMSTDGAGNTTWIAVAGTGTMTSLTPGSGLTSTITSTAPGSAVTAAGTFYSAQLVNAQTGTTYTVLDTDRAKMVTLSNTSSVAITLPQAGAGSAFQSGWFATVKNLNRGTVTITPTTSTINGAATLVLQRGQSAVIVSDGTNYQATTARPNIVVRTFTSSGTYTPTTGMSYCQIYCLGGGGGGGGVAGAANELRQAGGGGAGSLSMKVASASDIGASQTVTIGAAGTAGSSGANVGGNGGDTSVGSLCIGKGGTGGGGASTAGSGGAGGVAGTGDVTGTGARGFSGGYHNAGGSFSILMPGGNGGSSGWGTGGAAGAASGGSASTGGAASLYGAGGGGATATNIASNAAGGAGSAGLAWIIEYVA